MTTVAPSKTSKSGRRRSPRKRFVLTSMIMTIAGLWLLGFANFVAHYRAEPGAAIEDPATGGIVVFTGPRGNRVWFGMEALTAGRGERLLISGVNTDVTREQIRALVDDTDGLFDCCVDLDYVAKNTWQNARETAAWVEEHGYDELTLVTAPYHRQRSLVILHHFLPGAEIHVYQQVAPTDRLSATSPNGLRILAWEYTKYELALARIRLAHLFRVSP